MEEKESLEDYYETATECPCCGKHVVNPCETVAQATKCKNNK